MTFKDFRIIKSIGYVTAGTILGKLTGFLKHYLIVYIFGLTELSDAFFIANAIPEMLINILMYGLLAGAFIPVASEVLSKQSNEQFNSFINSILTFIGFLCVISAMVIFLIPIPIAKMLATGYADKQLEIVAGLLVSIAPGFIFLGLAAILSGILQVLEDFRIVSVGLFIFNLTFIISVLLLNPQYHIYSAGIGISLGAFFWFLSHLLFTYKRINFGQHFRLITEEVKRTGILALPSFVVITLTNLVLLLERNFASVFAEGTISELNLGFRLSHLFLTVMILPMSTVLFPRMAKYFYEKKYDRLKRMIRAIFQVITLFLILFLLLFSFNSLLITQIVYFFLKIQSNKIIQISEYALLYTFSFIGLFYYMFLIRIFYSMQKIWEIVKANLIGLFFYILSVYYLIPVIHSFAFPVSYAVYAVTSALYLTINLNISFFSQSKPIISNKVFFTVSFLYFSVVIIFRLLYGTGLDIFDNITLSVLFTGLYVYIIYKFKIVHFNRHKLFFILENDES
ncbi:MAG TPA: hypothetical protein ENK44_11955 [Caldithrix abyssi]|uniref:Murein biosynthesis integral membrane protein MurJ n=1 Tax=Caldithrix abyssi TaxID=187145 RepID=A0A7V4U2G0_CALAY|nr:hypothetical protein [Caldithrix abyssi]